MSRLGLPEGWIDRVMSCVTTLSFFVSINGKTYCNILPSRGLRRYFLSPYLFLLCVEGFSSLLARAKARVSFMEYLYTGGHLAFPICYLLIIHCYFVGLIRRKCRLFLKFYKHIQHHQANV